VLDKNDGFVEPVLILFKYPIRAIHLGLAPKDDHGDYRNFEQAFPIYEW
jgi:hypothetical protein